MVNGIKTKDMLDNIFWRHPKTYDWHRLDGPAYYNITNSCHRYRFYCIDGNLHNINGPARIWKGGSREYWIDGKCYYNYFLTKNQKHKWLLISLKRKLIDKKEH